jgi:hypothetical protein
MDEVDAVVRNPVGGLTDPTVFVVLSLAVVLAVWSRRRSIRTLVVMLVLTAVTYREHLLYIFLRAVVERRDLFGNMPPEFMHGLRLMHAYTSATELYPIGCSILLGALAVFGFRRQNVQRDRAE